VQNLGRGIEERQFTKGGMPPCALACRDLLIGGCSFGEANGPRR
jgi:hypothetical protein